MKTIKLDHLPDQVQHNGQAYYKNDLITTAWERNKTPLKDIEVTLKKEDRKAVIVEVYNKFVKGKKDLHGKQYPPSKWLFTTYPKTQPAK